jgi:hypothetical protein
MQNKERKLKKQMPNRIEKMYHSYKVNVYTVTEKKLVLMLKQHFLGKKIVEDQKL